MPTDLDELFQGLSRQADAIPIAPPEAARQRGRQLRRSRLVAAAVAVCLVAGGVSGLVNRPARQADPADTPSHRELPDVGSPIDLGKPVTVDYSMTAGGRVFSLWQATDGTINLLAADLHTGARAWIARRPAKPDTFPYMYVMSQGIALVTEGKLSVYDNADGRLRWELPVPEADRFLVQSRAVVRWSAETERIEAFDWAGGKRLWSQATPGEKPRGLTTLRSGDEFRPEDLIGEQVLRISAAGQARVMDIDTGTAGLTLSLPGPAVDDRMVMAVKGWVISQETQPDRSGYRLHATDTRTGTTRMIADRAIGHTLSHAGMCGTDRFCVLDAQDAKTTLTAIDLTTGTQVWEVPAPDHASSIESHGGYVLTVGGSGALYDRNGQVVYRAPDSAVAWLTADSLLRVAGGGPVERIRVADGHVEPVGTIPLQIGACAAVPDRLACPTSDGLRIWSLTG
ncbi:PQQ-like beta-propeller repeat protein [Actinoplanes sp. NBC_00393]|uniref:outer membrane protein assembly factor BamB family protein n=1 Tax=Actinoplanes sp. NBC_00393 TaxID=2975953 RepID=UPI002E203224